MKMPLDAKHIFITGGSMGIGKAAAISCLEAGATVTICARGKAELEDAYSELDAQYRARIHAVRADISERGDVQDAFASARRRFGDVAGVIHAAAIYGPIGPLDEVEPELWEQAIHINLYGTFLVARESCRLFKESGGGRLALFAGGGASSPFPNYSAYACSKAAVVRLTETLAIEMAEFGIEVNCIAPGMVATRMHNATVAAGSRAGSGFLTKTRDMLETGGVPAQIGAQCAAFLVSDAAKGITGKFVAAPYDGYRSWNTHGDALTTDIFTLRRIVPRDRGMDWQ